MSLGAEFDILSSKAIYQSFLHASFLSYRPFEYALYCHRKDKLHCRNYMIEIHVKSPHIDNIHFGALHAPSFDVGKAHSWGIRGLPYFVQMSYTGSQQLRLKEWLVLQINSGKYPGLQWENAEKTLFRIPWKHASKQDYKAQEDAALFKAWATYKGKFREGAEKDDPSVWKTRLRCALNKSPDFQEVQEDNQTDMNEPYKLYRIVAETQDLTRKSSTETQRSPKEEEVKLSCKHIQNEELQMETPVETNTSAKIQKLNEAEQDISGRGCQCTSPFLWATHPMDHKAIDISDRELATASPSSSTDFWLHIRLYYQGKLVTEVTTQTAEGCRIVRWTSASRDFSPFPAVSLEEINFPSPSQLPGLLNPEVSQVLQRLLLHLDNGVLLWVAPEGVFVKRQCQVRVYWSGPLAPYTEQPNKLERERTCKVLDTEHFMQELHMHLTHGGPEPRYQIRLCFGEEYPDPLKLSSKKLIIAHVEPVFAREQLMNAQKKIQELS
uniref:IRF tryptophan pentad repeat domain-containing protein n=2 Tax=Leptobrachium leishanense TaxID=445787 RepID=A0A8C5QD65_9ANUR